MTAVHLSQLQKRILRWLAADYQRTHGRITSSHRELVRAPRRDKGNISHSLGTMAARGWRIIGRSSGGKPNPCGSLQRGRKRPPSLQEVVLNRKIF